MTIKVSYVWQLARLGSIARSWQSLLQIESWRISYARDFPLIFPVFQRYWSGKLKKPGATSMHTYLGVGGGCFGLDCVAMKGILSSGQIHRFITHSFASSRFSSNELVNIVLGATGEHLLSGHALWAS